MKPKLEQIKVVTVTDSSSLPEPEFDTKHLSVFNELKKLVNKPFKKTKVEQLKYDITKKTKICFVLLPEWDKTFPPYNVSRLVAVARNEGYEATGMDINVESWHYSKQWQDKTDYWHPASEWKWTGRNYWNMIHPYLSPLVNEKIDEIINREFDVVGLTIYYCNLELSNWFASELKKRKPSIKIIVGGPQAHHSFWEPSDDFDIIVSGEGEQSVITALDEIENGNITNRWIKQPDGVRIDLDLMPSPDFSWVDFSKYGMPSGVLMEFSRGCVAKCTFCGETHFWKYRNRRSESLLNEIENLQKNYGTDTIWFLDSLVNGNLKELGAFAKGVIERNLKIRWTGYARCDKRMDLEYYKDLADSGCFALNYGIESGSNKVLEDMAKRITVDEIEQNLQDGASVGIRAMTNWIIGFPTETPQDFYDTLTLIIRNYKNINQMSPGIGGFIVIPDTIVGQNFDRFNLYKAKWENEWITKDFKNTKIHRLIRQKIFLIIMNEVGLNEGHPADFYNLNFNRTFSKENKVEYEKFDFEIIKDKSLNPVAYTFINEVFVALRLLWKWKGAFSLTLNFNRDKDWKNFGGRLGCDLNGTSKFTINENGEWVIDIDYEFNQREQWSYHGYEEADSIAAIRARRLSKREFKEYTWKDLCDDMKVIENLNEYNFSFKYKNIHQGVWI